MAQSDIYGLRKAVTKQVDLTIQQYNGTAKDGELLVDMNPGASQYQLFVGTISGQTVGVTASTATSANVANYAGNVTGAAQPNITSVGTLTSLVVNGNATIGGNLAVDGTITYINSTTVEIQDPIIFLGGGPNGAPLTTNDGKDRGTQLEVYDVGAGAQVAKFMGWDNSAEEFIFGSDVTNAADVISVNTFGNVRAAFFIGDLDGTASAANVAYSVDGANVVGEVSSAAVANSVAGANVSGQVAFAATANAVAGANVSGQVAFAATANAVAGANVSGQVAFAATANAVAGANVFGEVANANYANWAGTAFSVDGGNVSGEVANAAYATFAGEAYLVDAANVNGIVANANYADFAGDVVTAAQPNITSVGTLTGLSVSGITTLGPVGNVSISGGTTGQILRTDGAGTLSWVNANTAPGVNGELLLNVSGTIGSDTQLTYDTSTDTLSTPNLTVTDVSVNGNVKTSLIPSANVTYDLGNATNRWGNIYLSNNSLYLGLVHVTSDNAATVNVPNLTATGNLSASNLVATANVSGGNLTTGGAVVATGNVSGGNLTTGGVIAATGNITGGNINTSGVVSAAYLNANTATTSNTFTSKVGTASGGIMDYSTGDFFALTISAATSLSVVNTPPTGRVCTIMVQLTNPGTNVSYSLGSLKWAGGTPPTLTTTGVDVLGFYTVDGGSNWVGLVLGLNIS